MIGLQYALNIVFLPFFGMYVDRYGNRVTLKILSVTLQTFAYVANGFANGWLLQVILAFSYAISGCVMWPSIAFLYPKQK